MLPQELPIIKGQSFQMVPVERLEKEEAERKTLMKPSQRKQMELFLNTAGFDFFFFLMPAAEE